MMTQSHLFKLGCRLNCSDPFAGTDRLFDKTSGSFAVFILENSFKTILKDRMVLTGSNLTVSCLDMRVSKTLLM